MTNITSSMDITLVTLQNCPSDLTVIHHIFDKAAELGCVNTHFVNPHGLHDENHYTCARDMALIMQAALKNKMFCKIIDTV